jgi:molecular chaperone DnaK (HSP70)
VSPQAVHRLLGRNDTHEVSADFFDDDQYIAHGAVKNARGGYDVTFPDVAQDEEEVDSKTFKLPSRYSVEEITAMILAHGREFSEAVAEAKIKDCVITVPAFYTQNERLALIDAAELAGLNVSCGGVSPSHSAVMVVSLLLRFRLCLWWMKILPRAFVSRLTTCTTRQPTC